MFLLFSNQWIVVEERSIDMVDQCTANVHCSRCKTFSKIFNRGQWKIFNWEDMIQTQWKNVSKQQKKSKAVARQWENKWRQTNTLCPHGGMQAKIGYFREQNQSLFSLFYLHCLDVEKPAESNKIPAANQIIITSVEIVRVCVCVFLLTNGRIFDAHHV